MYANHSIALQVAKARQRDMMAAAEHERRARSARPAAVPVPATGHRSRRSWRLVPQLRTQAQS